MYLINIFALGLAAGIAGTAGGGLIAVFTHRKLKLPLSSLLGFAAGIMLAVVFKELIPHAIEDGGLVLASFGIMLGVLVMMGLDNFLPHKEISDENLSSQVSLIRVGVLLGIGIALHNFPEGIAIGTSFARDPVLGITIAFVLTLHNIPEGMAMAIPLSAAEISPLKVLWYTVLAGVPMGFGSFIGGWIGMTSPVMLSIGLGFAGGAMLYITCHELIPGAQKRTEGHAATAGIAVGVILAIIILLSI